MPYFTENLASSSEANHQTPSGNYYHHAYWPNQLAAAAPGTKSTCQVIVLLSLSNDLFVVSFLGDKNTIVFMLMKDSRAIANSASCSKNFLRQKDAVNRLWIVQVKLSGRGELCSSRRDSDTSKPKKTDHTTHTIKNATKKAQTNCSVFSYNLII